MKIEIIQLYSAVASFNKSCELKEDCNGCAFKNYPAMCEEITAIEDSLIKIMYGDKGIVQ